MRLHLLQTLNFASFGSVFSQAPHRAVASGRYVCIGNPPPTLYARKVPFNSTFTAASADSICTLKEERVRACTWWDSGIPGFSSNLSTDRLRFWSRARNSKQSWIRDFCQDNRLKSGFGWQRLQHPTSLPWSVQCPKIFNAHRWQSKLEFRAWPMANGNLRVHLGNVFSLSQVYEQDGSLW